MLHNKHLQLTILRIFTRGNALREVDDSKPVGGLGDNGGRD